jgi:hypothetical protein
MAQMTKAKIVGPKDGKAGSLGSIGVRFMIDGDETGDDFSLVEHPCRRAPRRPLHKHSQRMSTASSWREDGRAPRR